MLHIKEHSKFILKSVVSSSISTMFTWYIFCYYYLICSVEKHSSCKIVNWCVLISESASCTRFFRELLPATLPFFEIFALLYRRMQIPHFYTILALDHNFTILALDYINYTDPWHLLRLAKESWTIHLKSILPSLNV